MIVLTSSCAVPLAPGYRIVKETREIRFVGGAPGALEVHTNRTLRNSGTANLNFIDVTFPGEKEFGRNDLRVAWDGHEAKLSELPAEDQPDHPSTLRIEFDAPWLRGQTHELTIDYRMSSPEDAGSHITVGEGDFHLGSRGWMALPQPPAHFLATYPDRPNKSVYSVRVPADFLLLGRGKMAGRKRTGSETEYRFRLRSKDLSAFVVAGNYKETAFRTTSGSIVFWTHGPLKSDPGATPQRLASAWQTLEADFGPIDPNIRAVHIVESTSLREREPSEGGAAVAPFPGGALVNEETLALGVASDALVERVTRALARNWFGDAMYPTSEAEIPMGEGLPEYATIVVEEARNGSEAKRRRIEEYLRRYEDGSARSVEKPLGVTTLTDAREQRDIALAKAPLMYAALEDRCGEAAVRNGLKQLVVLLRGQEVGINDMRSAIEHACGKDLGEFFRVWLYSIGIPEDFRSRYEAAAASGK